MIRLIITIIFCFALSDTSFGQIPKDTLVSKTIDKDQYTLEDTVFLKLVKAYSDSVSKIVDSLLNDTAFLQSINDSTIFDHGEFASSAFKIEFPVNVLGWTNDHEHIFTPDQISEFDSIISRFEKETTNEIAIVTIDSSLTTKEEFDSFTLEIAKRWGIGKKEKNNGILIGISSGLKKIRIQNGTGIEAILSNEETKSIIDKEIIPEFKQGNYYKGTKQGLMAIIKLLSQKQ